ncbi:MAG: cation-transporting P-type ATPase [Pseudomonadota bacterium]|nr:cation-transporting P-type ATPase [Pseudomonadota bacterium]
MKRCRKAAQFSDPIFALLSTVAPPRVACGSGSIERWRVLSALLATTDWTPDLTPITGLSHAEAQHRLAKFGPNAMPDTAVHP